MKEEEAARAWAPAFHPSPGQCGRWIFSTGPPRRHSTSPGQDKDRDNAVFSVFFGKAAAQPVREIVHSDGGRGI
jgi:hypothetical protein